MSKSKYKGTGNKQKTKTRDERLSRVDHIMSNPTDHKICITLMKMPRFNHCESTARIPTPKKNYRMETNGLTAWASAESAEGISRSSRAKPGATEVLSAAAKVAPMVATAKDLRDECADKVVADCRLAAVCSTCGITKPSTWPKLDNTNEAMAIKSVLRANMVSIDCFRFQK